MSIIKNIKGLFSANPTTTLSARQKKVVIDLMRQNMGKYRRELDTLRAAREMRYDVMYPSTHLLQGVYTDSMMDSHLTAITENRILRIINNEFSIFGADGKVDAEKTKLIEEPWFMEMTRAMMESIFFGYSMIHITDAKGGRINEIELIPREHIIPEKGWIINHISDTTKGLPFREFPNDLIYTQMYNPIGLLEKASPMTILKRHSWGSWDEFEQMFGIPIRIAKVASGNDDAKREVSQWLEEMGRSAAGVFPVGTEIEIKENSKADAFRVFFEKIQATNSEMSKLINGQTMTTENGSSKSQGEVHLKTQDEITKADTRMMTYWLNKSLMPLLIRLGYPFSDKDTIGIPMMIQPSEKIKVDAQLMSNGIILKEDYLERIYGVEIESNIPKEKKKP